MDFFSVFSCFLAILSFLLILKFLIGKHCNGWRNIHTPIPCQLIHNNLPEEIRKIYYDQIMILKKGSDDDNKDVFFKEVNLLLFFIEIVCQ